MVTISIARFNALNIQEQIDLLCRFGTHLSAITTGRVCCSLYAFNSFYTESVFDHAAKHHSIKAFSDGQELDKYLALIELPAILVAG